MHSRMWARVFQTYCVHTMYVKKYVYESICLCLRGGVHVLYDRNEYLSSHLRQIGMRVCEFACV